MRKAAAEAEAEDAAPTCRKGAMLSDSMQLSSFPFMNSESNFLLGGKSGPDYDQRVWRRDRQAWLHAKASNSPARPSARWKGSFCKVHDTRLVLFGGSESAEVYLNDVWLFDPLLDLWEELHPSTARGREWVISPRRAHSGVVVDSRHLVVFGGSRGDMDEPLKDLWTLDLELKLWTNHKQVRFPLPARKGHTAAVVGRRMFVFGGRRSDTEYFDDLVALDFAPSTWTPTKWTVLPSKNGPAKRNHHVSIPILGDHLLVYGGRGNHDMDGEIMNDVWLYRTTTQAWSQVTKLHLADGTGGHPKPRIEAAYGTGRDNQLVMGFGQASPKELLNDLWTLDVQLDSATGVAHGTWENVHSGNCTVQAGWALSGKQARLVDRGPEPLTLTLVVALIAVVMALYRWRPNRFRSQQYEAL